MFHSSQDDTGDKLQALHGYRSVTRPGGAHHHSLYRNQLEAVLKPEPSLDPCSTNGTGERLITVEHLGSWPLQQSGENCFIMCAGCGNGVNACHECCGNTVNYPWFFPSALVFLFWIQEAVWDASKW